MKAKTRHALWGGLALGLASMTMGTGSGCGNGYSVNNDEPVNDEGYQANLHPVGNPGVRVSIPHEDNSWRPEGPYGNMPDPREPRGPFNPGDVDYPTQGQGWGVYCVRKQTPGSTHFGFLTNYSLSDADGLNEIGLVAYGEVTKKRFMQEYPSSTEAVYNHSKRNFGNPGDEDALALYVVDNEGNETEFALKRIECESLDKLLELYKRNQ